MKLTKETLYNLRRVAEAAKKSGVWQHSVKGPDHVVTTSNGREWTIGDAIYHPEDDDAEHIAAFHPTVALALIARIESLEGALKRLSVIEMPDKPVKGEDFAEHTINEKCRIAREALEQK